MRTDQKVRLRQQSGRRQCILYGIEYLAPKKFTKRIGDLVRIKQINLSNILFLAQNLVCLLLSDKYLTMQIPNPLPNFRIKGVCAYIWNYEDRLSECTL